MLKGIKKYIVEAVLAVILIVGFVLINKKIDKRQIIMNENVKEYHFKNDSVKNDNGKLIFKGWCYRYNMNTPQLDEEAAKNFRVVLFDESAEINSLDDLDAAMIVIDTVRTKRTDVNDTYGASEGYKYDYTYSGYEATVDISLLDLENKDYVIAYRYGDKSNHLVRSTVHLNKILK